MRELKFKTWDRKEKEMYPAERLADWTLIIEEERYDILQFTGLLDKNGKEIYEGDVVKTVIRTIDGHDHKESGEVKWNYNDLAYDIVRSREKGDFQHLFKSSGRTVEVIGNIYENPDLLK